MEMGVMDAGDVLSWPKKQTLSLKGGFFCWNLKGVGHYRISRYWGGMVGLRGELGNLQRVEVLHSPADGH